MNNKQLMIGMAKALKPMLDRFVFVGGCAVDYLIDDSAVISTRVTGDVDVIAEIATRHEYYAVIDGLKSLGFAEVMHTEDEPTPICRMQYNKMILDVMPTDADVLGFSNPWYLPAVKNSNTVELEAGLVIRLVSPTYFIATKLIAFRTRGQSEPYSHDFEDIITLINGNSSIIEEIQSSDSKVKKYLRSEFNKLLSIRGFKSDYIAGNLVGEPAGRSNIVYQRILDICL